MTRESEVTIQIAFDLAALAPFAVGVAGADDAVTIGHRPHAAEVIAQVVELRRAGRVAGALFAHIPEPFHQRAVRVAFLGDRQPVPNEVPLDSVVGDLYPAAH